MALKWSSQRLTSGLNNPLAYRAMHIMTMTWVYALLAIVLAVKAVIAFEAISKLAEPHDAGG
jgi:hypothetical protein